MPKDSFFRYENPFEKKWAVKDKFTLNWALNALILKMEVELRPLAEVLFGFGNGELSNDAERHFCGIFQYDRGDSLGIHCDAGLHPRGFRKHVTALLYLGRNSSTNGDLCLWDGTSCTSPNPKVIGYPQPITPVHGRVVLLENNDY